MEESIYMSDIKTLSDNNRAAIMAKLNSLPVAVTSENRPDKVKTQIKLKDTPQHEELVSQFIEKISASKANVFNIESINDLPAAVKKWLDDNELSNTIYGGKKSLLNNIDWAVEKIDLSTESFTDDGKVAISTATCAIADTGSLVLLSGLENPAKNNFLAEHHLVALDKNTIIYRSEDAWDYLLYRGLLNKEQLNKELLNKNLLNEESSNSHQPLPRAVNFISGPSSSADVGLTLEYGAHGPRTLSVFIF